MSEWTKKLEIYDRLVATAGPEIVRKGKTMPYTSANGYMFSLLNKDAEIGIRLSKESCKKFMEEFKTTVFKSHGATMRDYVLIPEEMLDDLDMLASYLEEGYKHVMSLPPK